MKAPVVVKLEGKEYVFIARADYERLAALARVAELPPLPTANKHGQVPAAEYARASIAREIVRRRAGTGLTQRELAARAGVRVETLCRIETGKHTPSTATIAKLEHALAGAEKGRTPGRR